jgi:hypothetical protein
MATVRDPQFPGVGASTGLGGVLGGASGEAPTWPEGDGGGGVPTGLFPTPLSPPQAVANRNTNTRTPRLMKAW